MQSICCQIIKSGTLLKPFLDFDTHKNISSFGLRAEFKKEGQGGLYRTENTEQQSIKVKCQICNVFLRNLNFDHFMVIILSNSLSYIFSTL